MQLLTLPKRPPVDMDTECYPDWWLIKFWMEDGRFYSFERTAAQPLNIDAVKWFVQNFTMYSFNGDNYDIPMISLALSGADNRTLKQANDAIIVGGLRRWDFYRAYGVQEPAGLDHVDLMEPTPGVRIGLKTYMGRMHCAKLQDLPYSPNELTTPDMRRNLDLYCGNDLDGNRNLRTTIAKRLALRVRLSERYGVDVRSKSDAQMAEAVFKARLSFVPDKRYVPHGYQFQYTPPDYIRFSTPELQAALEVIRAAWFVVYDVDQIKTGESEDIFDTDGKKIKTGVKMPPELKKLVITIGGTQYKLGIGGLHSQEKSVQFHTIIGKHTIRMDDVTSYYPSLIINLAIKLGLTGEEGQKLYQEFRADRVAAKVKLKGMVVATGEYDDVETIVEGLKIFLNGTFGKLFSKYSIFYSPEGGIATTLTGQLSLLMLIESLTLNGVPVISANTDGIVTLCPVGREWLRDGCISYWSKITNLGMESTYARSLYARDVNSYVLIEADGSVKRKGAFAETGVLAGSQGANPEKDIVADAVVAYLKDGTPLINTIRGCNDLRKFLVIRTVKGGGTYEGQGYLGKTVRWYYAAGEQRHISYSTNGNKVAGSAGARPAMDLPEAMPADVDFDRYHADAVKMLETLGMSYQQ